MNAGTSEPTTAELEARRAARRYPDRPIVAVLAVVLRDDRVLIVQRAQQPNAGRWGFPGGVLELGETVAQGAMRELLEEMPSSVPPSSDCCGCWSSLFQNERRWTSAWERPRGRTRCACG